MVHSNFNPCPNICKNKNEFGICKSDKCINPYFNTSVTFTNTLDNMKFKDKNKSLIEIQAYNKFAALVHEEIDQLKLKAKIKSQLSKNQAQIGQGLGEFSALCKVEEKIKNIRDQLIEEVGVIE